MVYPLLADKVVSVVLPDVCQGAEEHGLVRASHLALFKEPVEHADVARIGIRGMLVFGHADGMWVVLICYNVEADNGGCCSWNSGHVRADPLLC